jgi:hypothetical protein
MEISMAENNIARRSIPSIIGEFLIFVAVSNHIIKRTAPAIKKSECFFRNAGKGLSSDTSFLARFAMTPIGHSEHQNRAQKRDPTINIGHPKAQLTSAAGFCIGSDGPRNKSNSIRKKNGVTALCSIAG